MLTIPSHFSHPGLESPETSIPKNPSDTSASGKEYRVKLEGPAQDFFTNGLASSAFGGFSVTMQARPWGLLSKQLIMGSVSDEGSPTPALFNSHKGGVNN